MKKLIPILVSVILSFVVISNVMAAKPVMKTYTFGVDVTYPPFEMQTFGKITGFDIDLIHAIAKKEHFKIHMQTMQFEGIILALQRHAVDAAVAGATITKRRAQIVNFSDAYYRSGLSVLVKKNSHISGILDLIGKRVATRRGTSSVNYLMNHHVKTKKVLQFPNISTAYSELAAGGADAVLYDNPINLHFLQSNGNETRYKIAGPLLTGEYYGIMIAKGQSELLQKIQAGLKAIKADGTYKEIYNKYFHHDKSGLVEENISPEQTIATIAINKFK